MRRRHVVVLFQHRLFGDAIARVLSENDQLLVTTLPIDALSADTLKEMRPDAIVLEEDPSPGDIKTSLLDVAPALTVVVGPEANTAEIYEKHEVIQATAAEIIARITGSRPPLARRPSGASVRHKGEP
jgi:hypothetical protein